MKWPHSARGAGVVADQSRWSKASKRSRAYEPDNTVHYHDEFYWCERCEEPWVFTAVDQKQAYKVEKRYLYQTCKLFDACHAEGRRLHATETRN